MEEVRCALKLDKFMIFGHSHGSMLAVEYAIKYGELNKQHLQAIILSNASMSYPARIQYIKHLITTWPASAQEVVRQHKKSPGSNQAEMEAVMGKYLIAEHFIRVPMPQYMIDASQQANNDIVQHMFGSGPFFDTGPVSTWSVMDQLANVKTRTLLIVAKYDWAPQSNLEEAHRLMPNSEIFIAEGSHMSVFDDADNYFSALVSFIKRASNAQ